MPKIYFLILIFSLIFLNSFSQVIITGSAGANASYGTLKAAFDALNSNGDQTGNAILINITGNTTVTNAHGVFAKSILNTPVPYFLSLINAGLCEAVYSSPVYFIPLRHASKIKSFGDLVLLPLSFSSSFLSGSSIRECVLNIHDTGKSMRGVFNLTLVSSPNFTNMSILTV